MIPILHRSTSTSLGTGTYSRFTQVVFVRIMTYSDLCNNHKLDRKTVNVHIANAVLGLIHVTYEPYSCILDSLRVFWILVFMITAIYIVDSCFIEKDDTQMLEVSLKHNDIDVDMPLQVLICGNVIIFIN